MSGKHSPKSSAPAFTLGDVVRRKYDTEEAGMIVGMIYRMNSCIEFLVSWSGETEEHKHYAEELQLDEDSIEKAN